MNETGEPLDKSLVFIKVSGGNHVYYGKGNFDNLGIESARGT